MVEGCQRLYDELKTLEAGLNALNQSTVALAYKHSEVVEWLNATYQMVLAMQQIMGEQLHYIKQVDHKGGILKK